MGRKEKQKPKLDLEEEDEAEPSGSTKPSNSFLVLSNDDAAANEDLSLKIVEKGLLMRAAKLVPNAVVPPGHATRPTPPHHLTHAVCSKIHQCTGTNPHKEGRERGRN